MSAIDLIKKFDEFEEAMRAYIEKVDFPLIVDLLLRQKEIKRDPIYTLEVFIKPNQDTEKIRNNIMNTTGTAPAFYDSGTHIVVTYRINFDLLKRINDIESVELIKGTYVSGMASIGPTYER